MCLRSLSQSKAASAVVGVLYSRPVAWGISMVDLKWPAVRTNSQLLSLSRIEKGHLKYSPQDPRPVLNPILTIKHIQDND